MSRTNLILLAILIVVAAVWLIGHDWDEGTTSAPAARLFPDFNKEAADGIVIEGGWQKTRMVLGRTGSEWRLASAGDYPVKKEAADDLIDAVYNLRKLNVLGTSAELQKDTHTGAENGRQVTILRDGAPMARFFIGRNPLGAYQEVFVRVDGNDTVYRDRTILSKDKDAALPEPDQPFGGGGSQGFQWHNYLNTQSTKWLETEIWDLADAEPTEIWLTRRDELDVKLVKKSDDAWDLIDSGKDPVPGDADAADGILGTVRKLSLYEVAGTYENVAKEYGLDKPEMTLVMTLRKKVEPKEKPAGEEKKDEEKEAPQPEYITINRILEVGPKVQRPRFDSYKDEYASDDYYPIRIGPRDGFDDAGEERRTNYVFLVNSYKISPLKKNLEDLKAEVPEEPADTGEKKESEEPGDEPEEEEEKEAEPKEDEPKEEPKDEPTDPKKDEPKDE
ncbi:MAG: DUF4340 domain-containing protein [Planctomycetota bacterium]|jgi:hypothetical protein